MIAFSVYFMLCKYTKSQLYTQDYKVKKHYIVTKMPLWRNRHTRTTMLKYAVSGTLPDIEYPFVSRIDKSIDIVFQRFFDRFLKEFVHIINIVLNKIEKKKKGSSH